MKAITNLSTSSLPETMDFHRAVVSLIEELEAVDWYNQRVDACTDPELRGILAHNRDEEIEHASMTLEWIRRQNSVFDRELREALFKTGPITDHRLTPGMGAITRESLLSLEAYARARGEFRERVLSHKKARTVHLGDHVTLLFEDELTVRYQIQEMLRIEKVFEEAGIRGRARRLQPARARRHELQGDDADRVRGSGGADRRARAARRHRAPRVDRGRGLPRVCAIADEDLPRETDTKTAAVHFLRFELAPEMVSALRGGAGLAIGVDHPAYEAVVPAVAPRTLAALAADLA